MEEIVAGTLAVRGLQFNQPALTVWVLVLAQFVRCLTTHGTAFLVCPAARNDGDSPCDGARSVTIHPG